MPGVVDSPASLFLRFSIFSACSLVFDKGTEPGGGCGEVIGSQSLYRNVIVSWLIDRIRTADNDSSIILRINGTAILYNFPVLENEKYLGTFRYDFKA